MFDIGFSEIVLISVVSLVVLGPEKLPGAVRTAALMIGRLKRTFNTLKTEIEKEIGADEIRRQLRNEDIMEKFKQTQNVLNDTINSVKEGTEEFRKNIELESESAGWSSHGGGPAADTASEAASTETAAIQAADSAVAAPASMETVTTASEQPASPPQHTETPAADKSAF